MLKEKIYANNLLSFQLLSESALEQNAWLISLNRETVRKRRPLITLLTSLTYYNKKKKDKGIS